jgi:hypothetical protein
MKLRQKVVMRIVDILDSDEDIYKDVDSYLEDDMISPAEEGFLRGYLEA